MLMTVLSIYSGSDKDHVPVQISLFIGGESVFFFLCRFFDKGKNIVL